MNSSIPESVLKKHYQQTSVLIPRAKLHLSHDLRITVVEDISNQQADDSSSSTAADDFMGHTLGYWPLEKTYWLNFHQ